MPINAIFGETVRTISNPTVSTENTGVLKLFWKHFFFFCWKKNFFIWTITKLRKKLGMFRKKFVSTYFLI